MELTAADASIEEAVLLDEAGVKITAKKLDTSGVFGPELKLLIENNSGKNLTFQCRNASVNGYMTEGMMSVDVVTGKSANDSLTFMKSELDLCGIDAIADIEFSFHIFDSSSWDTYLDSDRIRIRTSIADTYTCTYDDSGTVLYEGNGVKVVSKGISETDSLFGPSIILYIENTGSQDLTLQTRDVSVNGFMLDAIFSCDVLAGKHAVSSITFLQSELDENDIAEIESIELSFHIFDMHSWDTVEDTETICISELN